MSHSDNPILQKVYAARTDEERQSAYNDWSNDYDRDVLSFGIRLPFVGAAMFARHVDKQSSPTLDAACGTGMQTEPLALAGYSGFTGIDISDGMLALAAEKKIHDQLLQMPLDSLQFVDGHFATSYCIGALAPGHGPVESLDEMCRVTKTGGLVIFSTHAHESTATGPYHARRREMEAQGQWQLIDETKPFVSMPGGDAAIKHAIYVYRVAR